MGLATFHGVGEYAAGQAAEAHVIARDRLYRPDGTRSPIITLHSAGGAATEFLPVVNNSRLLLEALAEIGPSISFDGAAVVGGVAQHWGNPFSQARLTDAKNFLQTRGAKAGKALLVGVSMGGLLALNYARANPGLVAAVALLFPAVNLQWIHDNGGAASTEAAHGGSLAAFNAAVAAHNPQAHAAEYAALGVPMKMWHATPDATVSATEQVSFAAAAGIERADLGNVGHANMAAVPAADVRDFLLAHLP